MQVIGYYRDKMRAVFEFLRCHVVSYLSSFDQDHPAN